MITTTKNVKAETRTKNPPAGEPREIPLDLIDLHPLNPRETIDKQEVERLGASLDREGLLQRPIVRPIAGGKFQLIAGSRRFAAARAAKWKTLPVEVRDVSDADAVQYLVVENLLRRQLNPIEHGKAVALLLTPASAGGAGKSLKEVAAMLGKSKRQIWKLSRLAKLPDPWRSRVARRQITNSCGFALASYVGQPEILAGLEEDFRNSPEHWRGDGESRKRVVFVADRLGAVTNRVRRTELLKRADELVGTVDTYREIAARFDVSRTAVETWRKTGAPIEKKPYDLAAIAAWLQQRQERDNAEPERRGSRPTVLAPTRRAPAVKVFDDGFKGDGFKPAPKMRARPLLLTETAALDLIGPYLTSMGDLQLLRIVVEGAINDLKLESKK